MLLLLGERESISVRVSVCVGLRAGPLCLPAELRWHTGGLLQPVALSGDHDALLVLCVSVWETADSEQMAVCVLQCLRLSSAGDCFFLLLFSSHSHSYCTLCFSSHMHFTYSVNFFLLLLNYNLIISTFLYFMYSDILVWMNNSVFVEFFWLNISL